MSPMCEQGRCLQQRRSKVNNERAVAFHCYQYPDSIHVNARGQSQGYDAYVVPVKEMVTHQGSISMARDYSRIAVIRGSWR